MLPLAHQQSHHGVGLRLFDAAERHGQQTTGVGMKRGFGKLLFAHFAQTFESGDAELFKRQPFFLEFTQGALEFAIIGTVNFLFRFFPLFRNVNAEKRRLSDKDVPFRNQFREVTIKECQKKNLDVAAVNVGVGQNADLAVTKPREIRVVVELVRIDAHGHRDVVNHLAGKDTIAVDFPGIEYLAAQREDRLMLLVASLLGRAARRVTFHEENFVAADVGRFAIGELARQHCHARRLLLFDLLSAALTRLRLANHQLGKFLALFNMIVEPVLELRPNEIAHQSHGIATCELFLGLALKLGIEHLGRQHETGAACDVVGQKLHALGHQAVRVHKGLERQKQTLAKTSFVRASGEVGIRFT